MIALKNATIYTITDGILENAILIIDENKIEAVGIGIDIPKSAKVYDLAGKFITPGFIDAHCHVGVFNEGVGDIGYDGNEATSPVTPEVKAVDGVYTDDEAFADALTHGITTLCIGPGSANVVGGQMCVVKNRSNILEEILIEDYVGLKCAFGENPKRVYDSQGKMPSTRMGVGAVLRKTLIDAQNYLNKKKHHENTPAKKDEPKAPFETNYSKEILCEVLEGKKPIRAHAHRTDDIQTAIRIAEEFDVKLVIEHCSEGHKIADFLAKKNVGVIIGPLDGTKPKVELRDMDIKAASILEKAGVEFAIMTDAPVVRIGQLFDDVRKTIRAGHSKENALRTITINPAKILGMDDKLGSIEAGKDADIVIFDRDPYDFNAIVETTIIDGKVLHGKLT